MYMLGNFSFLSLRFRAISPFLVFSQSELLMNEVHLTAAEVAGDRRLTENDLRKSTNVNVICVGFVVHLWECE